MSYMKNGEPYVKYNYDYDPNGNIIGEKVNDVLEKSYTFNNRGQLASSTFKDKGTRTYAYDSRGNRTKATGPVTEFKDRTETAYSWDAWDRLSNVKQGEETLASFKYDPSGIRYAKTTETGTTTYNCDNMGRVITEYTEEGIKAQNIWGNGILARKVDGATYYYLTNTHGDVMEILDESGKTVNRYKYDEWGNAIEAVETIENPIRFAGEYFDEETGLYYLRARYYDPSLARFISKDSYEGQVTNPQSLNQYTYCDNNPIMFVDPTGHEPILADWSFSHISDEEAKNTTSFAIGFVPIAGDVKDLQEAMTGVDLITGEKLSSTERKITMVMFFVPIANGKLAREGVEVVGQVSENTWKMLSECGDKALTPFERGRLFEKMVLESYGWNKNTKKIGNSIPDAIVGGRIKEVKDVIYITNSRQFREYEISGMPIDLIVSVNNKKISRKVT